MAAREEKLVFLSVGYATCHWCHVMEHESFEDEDTAAILNRDFVAIKVDREERPDIDSTYMHALHAMGQQGGWPMNVFLTPDKRPVMGGTYFPPQPRYGINSFKEILRIVNQAWRTRKTEMLETADALRQCLAQVERPTGSLPQESCFGAAYRHYDVLFDDVNYGFGTDANNKFPPSMALSFLMSHYSRTGEPHALEMVERTLTAMRRGGIYDQVGGGLCRYATDHLWLVPHFEKMLYDNALFLKALAECYQLSGKEFFREAAHDVIRYVERDLALADGGIASAEDADSEGEEGKFYVWSLDEFRDVTGADSGLLEELWNVEQEGVFRGENILHEHIHNPPLTHQEAWGREKAEIIRTNRERLLERRGARPRPLRDDKLLTSWNCLYIQALVKAGLAFDDQSLIQRAKELHEFISRNLFDSSGRLMRRYREGEVGIPGYLSDYAELGLASYELFRATCEASYQERAQSLTEEAIRLFLSAFGPFYDTGSDAEEVLTRPITGYDGVEPSGNSSMARLLCLLSNLGIDSQRYGDIAKGVFSYFRQELETHPVSCPAMLQAYALFVFPPTQIVLVGDNDNAEMRESLAFLNRTYLADASVVWGNAEHLASLRTIVPTLQGKAPTGDFTAYVCLDATCKPPISAFDELQGLFRK